MAIDIGKGITNAASIKWKGLDKVLLGLNKAIDKIEGSVVEGMLEASLLIKGEAQRITPVDTGNLKASAYVIWGGGKKRTMSRSDPTFKNKASGGRGSSRRFATVSEHTSVIGARKSRLFSTAPFAEVGFTANYATQVHENLKARHGKVDKVGKGRFALHRVVQIGQAKFLEQAFVQNSRRVFAIIVRRARIR
jgi:hypothetical protein